MNGSLWEEDAGLDGLLRGMKKVNRKSMAPARTVAIKPDAAVRTRARPSPGQPLGSAMEQCFANLEQALRALRKRNLKRLVP
jgi:hypothetical protein